MANRIWNSTFKLWNRYIKLLEERPLLTKCATGGALAFSADVVCQYGEHKQQKSFKEEFDCVRSARFTVLGAFLVSPTLHVWYRYLGAAIPGVTARDAMKRLFFDQVIFAPVFIPTFFLASLVLEGKAEEIYDKIKRELLSTVITNYIVWIPAQFINFRYVAPQLQVLFSNSVGFFWNIFLSYVTNRKEVEGEISDDMNGVMSSKEKEEKISDFISAVSSGIKISPDIAGPSITTQDIVKPVEEERRSVPGPAVGDEAESAASSTSDDISNTDSEPVVEAASASDAEFVSTSETNSDNVAEGLPAVAVSEDVAESETFPVENSTDDLTLVLSVPPLPISASVSGDSSSPVVVDVEKSSVCEMCDLEGNDTLISSNESSDNEATSNESSDNEATNESLSVTNETSSASEVALASVDQSKE